jgi:surfeit locus 1 family protein
MSVPNAVTRFFRDRDFRPRTVPTLAAVAFVALTITLGNWQRHRAAEKDALAAQFQTAARETPVELPSHDDAALALRFRAVNATGEYDGGRQILIDNKVRAGSPGFDVVAPLRLEGSGRYVLVDRGWIAQGASRRELPRVPPPAGTVRVTGRVNLPPQRYLELGREHAPAILWENLDIRRIALATGLDLLPVVIEQSGSAGTSDGLVRDWPPPDFGSAQHVSYMLQWYSFGALAVILWLGLNWRTRETRRGR